MSWLPGLTPNTKTSPESAVSPREAAARAKALREQVTRLRASLAGIDEAQREARERELGHAIAEAGGDLLDADSPRVVVAAICHAGDKALALQWMERLHDEASFAEVALDARYAEPRFAAAQHLNDDALLERVAAGTRERDKRVHRHCADILRARSDHVQHAARAEELIGQLDALAGEPAPLVVARLTQMERALQSLGDVPEAAPCRARLEQLFLRMRAESEALRQLHQIAGRVDALAAETVVDVWPLGERLDAWQAGLASLRESATALPDWTTGVATSAAMRAALAAIEAHLAELISDMDLYAAGEAFIAALDGAGEPHAWEALAKPRHAAARRLLDAKWAEHQERTRPAPAPVAEQAKPRVEIDLAAVQKALFALDQAIEQGRVADAERFDARIEKLLGAASLPRSLDARWKRARGEITRLR
ncbi:MAG: hypothetical protein OEW21_10920, partial [Betaproteobacteria bacterium]|nr:hypothetical protein [Betaproteobacteria bacterium]